MFNPKFHCLLFLTLKFTNQTIYPCRAIQGGFGPMWMHTWQTSQSKQKNNIWDPLVSPIALLLPPLRLPSHSDSARGGGGRDEATAEVKMSSDGNTQQHRAAHHFGFLLEFTAPASTPRAPRRRTNRRSTCRGRREEEKEETGPQQTLSIAADLIRFDEADWRTTRLRKGYSP